MEIAWDPRHTLAWDGLHETCAGPIQQHFAYGQALQALGANCLRARLSTDGELFGIAQFITRRPLGLIGLGLCSRGPLWLPQTPVETKVQACRLMAGSLPLRRPRFALFTPEAAQSARSDTAVPASQDSPVHELPGLTRVFTGDATVLLDLTASDDALRRALHSKWRNRLVAAEASALKFQRVGEKPAQYQWLLEREGLQRQARAYRALPAAFVPAWQVAIASLSPDKSAMLTVRCDMGRDAVAAMMFLLHGRSATYHLGWSNDEGRRHNAHNLLLWRALPLLREQGIVQLDLGGVNTQRGASLARFKLGTGGQVAINSGTYL
ncbi:MAG: GNAT family N-acetyltransferase [Burkholderiaceae bacterium]